MTYVLGAPVAGLGYRVGAESNWFSHYLNRSTGVWVVSSPIDIYYNPGAYSGHCLQFGDRILLCNGAESYDGGVTWVDNQEAISNADKETRPCEYLTRGTVLQANAPYTGDTYWDNGALRGARFKRVTGGGAAHDIEANGTIHLIYNVAYPVNLGMWYKKSTDLGATWSAGVQCLPKAVDVPGYEDVALYGGSNSNHYYYTPGGAVHGRGDKIVVVVPESCAIRNWYHPSLGFHHFTNLPGPEYETSYIPGTGLYCRVYTSDLITNYSLDGGVTWGTAKRSKCLDPHPRENGCYTWDFDSITGPKLKLGSFGNDVYAFLGAQRYYKPATKYAVDCGWNHIITMRVDHYFESPDNTTPSLGGAMVFPSVPIGIIPGWIGDLTLIDDGLLPQDCYGFIAAGTNSDSSECYAFAVGDTELRSMFANGAREDVLLASYPSAGSWYGASSRIDFIQPPIPIGGSRSFWW